MHFRTEQHEQTHYRTYKQGDQSCHTPSEGGVGLQSTSVVQRKSEQPSPFLQAAYPPNRSAAGIICRREGHHGPGLGNTGPDPISWASTLHRDCEPPNFRSSKNLLRQIHCTADICAITS
ncbi:unnamed protein product [Arctogadus glacialis]